MDTLDRAKELMEQGDFEEAIACLNEALRADDRNAEAYFGRGTCWHHLNEIDNALADYDTALTLDPELPRALMYRSSARTHHGDLDGALADAEAGMSLDPESPLGPRYRAYVRERRGEHDQAVADFRDAIRLGADDAGIHLWLCGSLQALGRTEEAIAAVGEALKIDPEHTDALETRAALRMVQGDYHQAEDDLARVHQTEDMNSQRRSLISGLLQEHYKPASLDDITITERVFPHRVRADLQRAVDRLFSTSTTVEHFCGVLQRYSHEGLQFTALIVPNAHDPAKSVPPQYEEIDIGEDEPVRCLKNGLWLLEQDGQRFAVLVAAEQQRGCVSGLKFEIAVVNGKEGTRITQDFFKHLEESVLKAESYRGKILSLELGDRFHGTSTGIQVHRLRTIDRDDVILPQATLALLDRNIIEFCRRRERLGAYGLSTKKGVLFYGPPGTGKTHTIHYLAQALAEHTMLLITAEQIGLLDEYMQLARLLQPSVVVMEDIDLIAMDREHVYGTSTQMLLHKLLNEMDGLRPDTDVLFILTTNRPESLEAALASRPGRIDQAIEFPLPDEQGRAKLMRLYSCGLTVPDAVIDAAVKRTDRVSASFIKELMRRAAQFQIERDEAAAEVAPEDIDSALEELLFSGGSLNRKLLGADVDE